MQNAAAFSNNDIVMIAWSYGAKPAGCMGFAIYRIDEAGEETVLPGFAVFKGDDPIDRPSSKYPIQKFYWKDPYARLQGERTGRRKFRYKIVPLEGKKHNLAPMKAYPFLTTNEVVVSPDIGDGIRVVFNRGLISTQRVAKAVGEGKGAKGSLLAMIESTGDPIRKSLSGDMIPTIGAFLNRTIAGGEIFAALYELGDKELLNDLIGLGRKLHIVLSNSKSVERASQMLVGSTNTVGDAGNAVNADGTQDAFELDAVASPSDKRKNKVSDNNQAARDALSQTDAEQWNRVMPDNHIGHNKFLVYVDAAGVPQAILTGSTNWTKTGLCTQTNNMIVIDDQMLAHRYLEYWHELAADTKLAAGLPKSLQGPRLRAWDENGGQLTLRDGSAVHSWFSPNTPAARSKGKNETQPPDMEDLATLIAQAKQAVLFLAFLPGTPSVANWAALAQKDNPHLFVRGCVTSPTAAEGFYYQLVGGTPAAHPKGQHVLYKQDYKVIAAEAFDRKVPEGWQRELLNAGIAIIHDKIVVIDPFSDFPIVVTGSHNLGHKASFDNDENLLIIRGNKALARAYMTHVLDVYDHFSARYWFNHGRADSQGNLFLEEDPEIWLARYFDANAKPSNAQLNFWMQATAVPQ